MAERPLSYSVLAMSGDDALGQLLPAGTRRGIQTLLGGEVRKRRKTQLAARDALAQLAVPTLIALLFELLQRAVRDNVGRGQQGARDGVDTADVSKIQIRRVDRLAPQLGIEVESTGGEPLVLYQLHQRGHEL